MGAQAKKGYQEGIPNCENIESDHDKKYWFWDDCIRAACGQDLKFGTKQFLVYYKIRVYELHGKWHICIAGFDRIAEDIGMGMTGKEVQQVVWELNRLGKLSYFEIPKDEKPIYRQKRKVWVTKDWLNEREYEFKKVARTHRKEQLDDSNTDKSTGNTQLKKANQLEIPSCPTPVLTEDGMSWNNINVLESISKDIESQTLISEKKLTTTKKVDKRNPEIKKCMEAWEKAFGKKLTTKPTLGNFACKRLIDKYGIERVLLALPYAAKARGQDYAPQIYNFKDLEDKWEKFETWINKQSPKQDSPTSDPQLHFDSEGFF